MGTRHPATVKRLLLITAALIVYGSLFPWRFEFPHAPADPLAILLNSWPTVWNRFALRDACVNLLFYLPFGAAAMWAMPRRVPRAVAVCAALAGAAALSVGMELTQAFVPGRVTSLFDVLCDTVGAAAGIVLALICPPPAVGSKRAANPAGAWPVLALFAAHQLYPLFPVISQTRLFGALARLGGGEGFALNEVWCTAGEWLAALVVLEAVFGRSRWVALGLLAVPLRMAIPGRELALHEVLGAALGWLAWTLLAPRLRLRGAVWLLGAAIVLRELAPFHLAARPSAFEWVPFLPSLYSEPQSAVVILARKAFEYGAEVWLLRAAGVSWVRAGVGVAAALAAMEWAQRWLPGRTPEITDAVLTLLLAFSFWRLDNFQRGRELG
jgi:VanZ family protein